MKSKILLFFILCCLFISSAQAQVWDTSAQWTWMSGQIGHIDRGYAPSMGVAATTNRPPARFNPSSWTDKAGNLWLFGGDYNNGNNGNGYIGNTLNDLWKYNITTNEWTWVRGIVSPTTNAGFNVPGVFGTQKITAPANQPGSRRGATCWTDASGNFWLFGGYAGINTPTVMLGYANDLWKYDPVANLWTWMSGANTFNSLGSYGTKGVAATTNQPRARGGSYAGGFAASWVDASGNFWIFGGYGNNPAGNAVGGLNDLWKYNPTTDVWTWMGGTDMIDQAGVYGTRGMANATNAPGGRYSPACWTDASGKLWMFGGYGCAATTTLGRLNDLWCYDPATNMWTWVGGSNAVDQAGVYGTRGVPAATNQPGGRSSMGGAPGWVDIYGKFWMYGGYGCAASTTMTYLSDLWRYDPATNMWTWMKGDPSIMPHGAVGGTQGTPSPNNTPGGRHTFAIWKDLTGNFWVFGGIYYLPTYINSTGSLWRLHQVVPPPPPAPVYSSARPNICAGEKDVTYTVQAIASATSYEWLYTGTGVTFSGGNTTTLPSNNLTFSATATSGTLRVRAVNAGGNSAYSDTVITVTPVPIVNLGPDIDTCTGNNIVLRSSVAYNNNVTYAWSTSASASSLPVTQSGTYWLEVNDNGCKASDTIAVNIIDIIVDLGPDRAVCDRDSGVVLTSTQPAGYHYLWSNGLSDTQMIAKYSGKHWLEVSFNSCKKSDTVNIQFVPTPDIYIGRDSIICEQFPYEIGMEIPDALYSWSTGAKLPFIKVDKTGTYVLEIDLNGCKVLDTVNITALPIPGINLGSNRDICEDQTIVLNGTFSGNSTYQWNTGETTASISVTKAGSYAVRVVSEHHCVGMDTILLTYFPKPVLEPTADTVVCDEDPLLLKPAYIYTDSLTWSDGSTASSITISRGGTYVVTAVNKCGVDKDTIHVRQISCDIWFPNAFTPNGDGKNDIFRALGNVNRVEGFVLSIYNRWGERVFYTGNKSEGWNGQHKGGEAPLGTYVYTLEYSIAGYPYFEKNSFELIR